jgi:hypothetical protein
MEINYLNLQKAAFEGVGAYDIPLLSPETFTDCELIGFNQAKTCKERGNKAVHFFLYDYQFERIWNRPDAYVDMLKQFKCIFSPDFSVYCDYPRALQIYNHYRKHWIGAYMQINGISVIPTIGWSNEDSFEWCFDGETKGSAVAVSSVGTQKNKQAKELFMNGYKEMLERLEPTQILFYGKVPSEIKDDRVINMSAFQERFRKK